MATHTLGSTTLVSTGNNTTSAYNEIINTFGFVMPANGYVTLLAGVFGDSGGGNITGQLLLFDAAYNLLAGGTAGGQTFSGIGWHTQATGPYFIAGGSTVRLGWWVSQGALQKFYTYGSGNWKGGNVSLPASGGSFPQPGSPYFQSYTNTYLQWIDPVDVTSLSPSSGKSGDVITINGSGFTGGTITGVTFNGISASFTVNSDTSISATVPNGYTTGTLTVSSDHGNDSAAFSEFNPTISSVSPSTAAPNQSVTITGYGFTDGTVSSITIDGISASYTVNSNTQITATIPVGAAGIAAVVVNTNHGSASYNIVVATGRVRRSNAWSFAGAISVRRGGTWVAGSGAQVRRSNTWVLGS